MKISYIYIYILQQISFELKLKVLFFFPFSQQSNKWLVMPPPKLKKKKKKNDLRGRKCMKMIDHVSAFLRFDLTIVLNILLSKE